MKMLKYLGRLIQEFGEFAWQNKAWWLVPMVLMLLLLALFMVTGQNVVPYLYPF
jgi:hypothetical protein